MRSSKTLTLSLAALLVGSGVAVLAVDATSGSASAEPPVAQSEAIQRKADAVFASFNGSRFERDAGAVLSAYALNGGMDRCMESAGFPAWDWSMPRAQNPVSRGLESSEFFAAPLGRSFTAAMLESAEASQADAAALSRELRPEQDAAIGKCLDAVPRVSEEVATPSPPAAASLRDLWWAMLRELDEKYGKESTYAACLADSDIDGLGQIASPDEATFALNDLLPPADLRPTSADDTLVDSASWKRLLAAETAWEKVDWECRGDVYNNHIADVALAIDTFAAAHATDIARARLAWKEISARAEDLGYDGSFAPLGR